MDTLFLIKKQYVHNEKRKHLKKWYFSNWMAACKRIHIDPYYITLYKSQFKVYQTLQHKTRYTELNGRESGEWPLTHTFV